jgi:stress-induced morphogen
METKDLESRLLNAYPDAQVVVFDSNGRGDHFEIRISSDEINKLSRVQRHQAILKLFDPEFKTGELHALSVKPIEL